MLESVFNKAAGLQTCNIIKKRLQHRCFPVNIGKFLRIPISKNICAKQSSAKRLSKIWTQLFLKLMILATNKPPPPNLHLNLSWRYDREGDTTLFPFWDLYFILVNFSSYMLMISVKPKRVSDFIIKCLLKLEKVRRKSNKKVRFWKDFFYFQIFLKIFWKFRYKFW